MNRTNRWMMLFALLLAASLFAFGCGDSEDDGGNNGGGGGGTSCASLCAHMYDVCPELADSGQTEAQCTDNCEAADQQGGDADCVMAADSCQAIGECGSAQ